jgi:hypothetical protein
MHRSLLVLALALTALTACSDPTYPVLNIGDSGSKPTAQILQGVLVLTEDDVPRYALQTQTASRVALNCEFIEVNDAMLGEAVLARGRYDENGEFIVESLHRIAEKPTDT